MDFINKENLDLITKEDIDTLIKFDNKGFLIGPDESLGSYADRLETLKNNIEELKRELEQSGTVELIGTQFSRDDIISSDMFQSMRTITQRLYGFEIDWVPGFFTDHRMGFLFAGCAMYSYDDFFAIFVIRKAFKLKERWIIYTRTELMAHELCHVAHIGFHTKNYEEIFAYQTSSSYFRRICGGVLRTTADTYLLLGCLSGLLIAQIINVMVRSPTKWMDVLVTLIFGISFLVFCLILFRYILNWHRFKKARTNLGFVFGQPNALPVLFRCDCTEIKEISMLKRDTDLRAWLSKKVYSSVRWRVIIKKFLPSN